MFAKRAHVQQFEFNGHPLGFLQLMILCKDNYALLHVISLVDWAEAGVTLLLLNGLTASSQHFTQHRQRH